MTEKKYWRVELDKVTRFVAYIEADTRAAARAIAITVEPDEMEEESVEWLEAEIFEADADEAMDGWIVTRPSGDEE